MGESQKVRRAAVLLAAQVGINFLDLFISGAALFDPILSFQPPKNSNFCLCHSEIFHHVSLTRTLVVKGQSHFNSLNLSMSIESLFQVHGS